MTGTVQIESNRNEVHERTSKMVLYIGIFSIVMLFAGLSSAYVISSYGELWVNMNLPTAFYISTFTILLSSAVIRAAVKYSNNGEQKKAEMLVYITIFLGLTFAVSQYFGWNQLVEMGSNPVSHVDNLKGTYGKDYTITYKGQELKYIEGNYYFPNDELNEKPLLNEISIYGNSSSSYIYALSVTHLVHVLGGLIFLIAIVLVAKIYHGGAINNLRLRLGATYWHFVDGLWLYLFLFLLLIH